jgi:hypothetical protein
MAGTIRIRGSVNITGTFAVAIPSASDARVYYRCAKQRYEEAEILNRVEKRTGAVYLAGYGIECILKALALMAVPANKRSEMLRSFRRSKAHDYEWIRSIYLISGGARFPPEINRHFTLVNDWSTDLRYSARLIKVADAEAFLRSAVAIIEWADGRLN